MIAAKDSTSIGSFDLGPLYEPEAVGFSFQAPGWYILAAILILLAIYIFIRWARKYVKNAYRREALKNLSAIEAGFVRQKETESLREALILLKLVAIQTFGREKVAPLYGNDWLVFLEETGKDTPFRKYSSSISAALYLTGDAGKDQAQSIMNLSKRWITTHA